MTFTYLEHLTHTCERAEGTQDSNKSEPGPRYFYKNQKQVRQGKVQSIPGYWEAKHMQWLLITEK